jgi:hypothetical protein
MLPPFPRAVLSHVWGDAGDEAEGFENKAVGCIVYSVDRQFGVFNGVREVPDLDGNLVEDAVVQGEVVPKSRLELERATRRARSCARALVLGMVKIASRLREVLLICQTVSPT